MPEAEALQPQVTAWEIADVEVGDIVVVRCAYPGDDIHTLKVNMRDGTNEFVWICKAKKTVNSRDRELHGIWFKNEQRNILHKLHTGLEDSCEIEDDLDILCIYPDTPGEFQLQELNQTEIIETLRDRRRQRQAQVKNAKKETEEGKKEQPSDNRDKVQKTKVRVAKGGATKGPKEGSNKSGSVKSRPRKSGVAKGGVTKSKAVNGEPKSKNKSK